MKQDLIENRLKEAVERAVPDVKNSVLQACENRKKEKNMTNRKNARSSKRWIPTLVAAALVLVLGGTALGYNYQMNYQVEAIVGLDVNPSVEIELNRREKVVEARALNDDGNRVLADMDLKGADLNVAVNALIGSLLKNGYITEMANSILVTVEGEDLSRDAALQEKLSREIDQILKASSVEASVLSQTLQQNDSVNKMADTYSISHGKAALIQKILAADPLKTEEDLAQLSVNELNLLVTKMDTATVDVASTGSAASDKAYIGEEAAQEIAFGDAGISKAKEDLVWVTVELDADDGRMVYEVDFLSAVQGLEYEYEINAVTGDILKREKERSDDWRGQSQQSQQAQADLIGEEAAKKAALAHAGIESAEFTKVRIDRDDGVTEYELGFTAGNTRYDYTIDAYTGNVLKAEQKTIKTESASSSGDGSEVIGTDAAKQKALDHAGLSESEVYGLRAELDLDNGRRLYEVEFKANGIEYDYEIDAYSGKVLKAESDRDD